MTSKKETAGVGIRRMFRGSAFGSAIVNACCTDSSDEDDMGPEVNLVSAPAVQSAESLTSVSSSPVPGHAIATHEADAVSDKVEITMAVVEARLDFLRDHLRKRFAPIIPPAQHASTSPFDVCEDAKVPVPHGHLVSGVDTVGVLQQQQSLSDDDAPPCTLEALDEDVAREKQRAADEAEEEGLEEAEEEDMSDEDYEAENEDELEKEEEEMLEEDDEGEDLMQSGTSRKRKGKAAQQRNRRKMKRAVKSWRRMQIESGEGISGLAAFAWAFRNFMYPV
jgi:hypothetical protein